LTSGDLGWAAKVCPHCSDIFSSPCYGGAFSTIYYKTPVPLRMTKITGVIKKNFPYNISKVF
jgi:hypothetical protein